MTQGDMNGRAQRRGDGTRELSPVLVAVFAVAVLIIAPGLAEACAVCYGSVDSPLIDGVNNGILVLLGVIAAVQIGFVALFLSIRRRARQVRQQTERFQVNQGGAG